MLDKERKDWYNKQIDDQQSSDQSIDTKQQKKFDMFDEDSQSDEGETKLTNTLEK